MTRGRRSRQTALGATLMLVLAATAARAEVPDWSRPRELPSLVVRWRSDARPCATRVARGRAFVLANDRILALDARTGKTLWEQPEVAGECSSSWQDPLEVADDAVLAASGERLFVLSRETGEVRHRLELGGRFSHLWVAPVRVEVYRDGAKPGDPTWYELLEVDGRAGRVTARRRLEASLAPARDFSTEVEVEECCDLAHVVVRRKGSDGGEPLWSATLPGRVSAWARSGDVLYVHVSTWGRGVLAALDWTTGALRQAAYGFRAVRQIQASEDLLIVTTAGGVLGVATRELGPPEARTRPAAAEARRILAETGDPWRVDDSMLDLQALGPDALPEIAEEAAWLEGAGFDAALYALRTAEYRPAAAALARRLLGAEPRTAENIVGALERLGGAGEVGPLASILDDPRRGPALRAAAAAALVGIGTPAATAAVEAALPTASGARRPWWSPPSPAAYLDLIGKPVDEKAQQDAASREDFAEYDRLGRGPKCARVELTGGRSLIVFPDGRLGRDLDLWAAARERDGSLGPATFLGVAMPGTRTYTERITARLEGRRLEIARRDEAAEPVVVDLDAAERDSDADGLPDLIEQRLGIDPERGDTDGDAIPDGEDLNPDQPPRQPEGEEQEIAAAIFRQFFAFSDDGARQELLLVASPFVLEWSGRLGPTRTVDPSEAAALRDAAGHQAPILSIGASEGARGPDERLYALSVYRGPLSAVSYQVLVRRLDGRWFIRRLEVSRVS